MLAAVRKSSFGLVLTTTTYNALQVAYSKPLLTYCVPPQTEQLLSRAHRLLWLGGEDSLVTGGVGLVARNGIKPGKFHNHLKCITKVRHKVRNKI